VSKNAFKPKAFSPNKHMKGMEWKAEKREEKEYFCIAS
jgi:hypothetical protein